MRCAQTGCEVTVDMLMETNHIPTYCPKCRHPLAFVLDRGEAAELFGLQEEGSEATQNPLPLNEEPK